MIYDLRFTSLEVWSAEHRLGELRCFFQSRRGSAPRSECQRHAFYRRLKSPIVKPQS